MKRKKAAAVRNQKIAMTSCKATSDFPPGEAVKLIFHGLMGICCNNSGGCEIGFHSRGNLKHQHVLRIRVRQNPGCDLLPPGEIIVPKGAKLGLEVSNPDVFDGVYFYQSPDERAVLIDDRDFRWIIDLEGDYFYASKLTKKSGVYKPKLIVENGLFYTLKKTNSTFRRQTPDGKDVKVLGPVAEVTAANIYLKPNGYVILRINDQIFQLNKLNGVTYEVYFDNHCELNRVACKFNPYNLQDKTERNDFYLNFQAFTRPAGKPEYELVLEHLGGNTGVAGICEDVRARISDEAPCSASGYGKGGGLP